MNETIKYKEATSFEEKFEKSPVERYQDKKTKLWNLRKKDDGSFISDVWFDVLITSSKFRQYEYDIFEWSGIILSEPPIKTGGAYPYFIKGDFYTYSSEGDFLSLHKNGSCGNWGPTTQEYLKYTRINKLRKLCSLKD